MKIIAAVPVALLAFGVLGCSKQQVAAPVDHPAAASTSSETNTFGESKDEAAGSAANARAANYGAEPPASDAAAPANEAPAPNADTAAPTDPKSTK